MTKHTELAERARAISGPLAEPKPMRRGSVSERYVKCSKAGCPCAERAEARHGPYYSWTRKIDGQTHSRFLTREQAELVRQQIAAGQTFRKALEALWEVCEAWADVELEETETAAPEAEKRGSARRSKRRSAKRSKTS
jgi:hypothetical protein